VLLFGLTQACVRALEQMGFKALATTSAGFARTLGRADNQVTLVRCSSISEASWLRRRCR